jgi:sortase A
MIRLIRISGWTMIWSGLLVLSYVGYQLFGTDLATAREQEQARSQLTEVLADRRAELEVAEEPEDEEEEQQIGGPVDEGDPRPEEAPAPPELSEEPAPPTGEIIGSIRIPEVAVDQVLYEGVDTETLKLGPGHIPETAFPGQPGNAAVSGHRTTYGRPFFDIDQLAPGDVIEVETAIGVHTYEVRELEIVAPTDVWVIEPREGAWLTLTTCHPKWSARERLIVFAELVGGPNLEYVETAA